MAETSLKRATDEDINQYFQIDALTKSGKKAQTPRWGLKPISSHRPLSSSRMVLPVSKGSSIQVRNADNSKVAPDLANKHMRNQAPLRDLENKLSAVSISGTPKEPSGTSKKTPGKVLNSSSVVDRFIPSRSSQNIEQSTFLLSGKKEKLSPGTQEYQEFLYSHMTAENPQRRILPIASCDAKSTSIRTPHELVRSANRTTFKPSARDRRVIPSEEEQILDAPRVLDDYCKYICVYVRCAVIHYYHLFYRPQLGRLESIKCSRNSPLQCCLPMEC